MVALALSASSMTLMTLSPSWACRFSLGTPDQPNQSSDLVPVPEVLSPSPGSGRRPGGDPSLEDGDVLRRPFPVAGHRAVAEARKDRLLVCLDVFVGPEVEVFEHRLAVLFTEHRTDITLEAQPCG